MVRVPTKPLAAIADRAHERAERGEAAIKVSIVAFDNRDLRRRLARYQIAFALPPILHLERLGHFTGAVVLDRRQHHVFLNVQYFGTNFRERLRNGFEDFPIGLAFPDRVHRRGERMDERVHVGGI